MPNKYRKQAAGGFGSAERVGCLCDGTGCAHQGAAFTPNPFDICIANTVDRRVLHAWWPAQEQIVAMSHHAFDEGGS